MQLTRAHGLGNDYLVLESGDSLDPSRVRAICDRHRGVGSDGILEPADPGDADYGVRIWNPDGSIAEKSGNGLRIFARWIVDGGAPSAFDVWTGFETASCEVGDDLIRVGMGRARFGAAEVPVHHTLVEADVPLSNTETVQVTSLSVGNPHAVVFVDQPFSEVPWKRWGEVLEVHEWFPNRTNVQIARVISDYALEIRIWERGAGVTEASGSSSCAAACAGVKTGRLQPGAITVYMPGGDLRVDVSPELDCLLSGPVEVIGQVTLDPRWLARHC